MSNAPRGNSTLQMLAIAFVVFTTRASFADHYTVPSGSMEPTIAVGDRLLVNKFAYGLRVPSTKLWVTQQMPARGDVVVFTHPSEDTVLVKRLVGLPGDVLAFDGKNLWINGKRIRQELQPDGKRLEWLGDTPHELDPSDGQGPPQQQIAIPPDRFFFMGDHRGNSADSRAFGLVPRENLLGRATAIAWSSRKGGELKDRMLIPLNVR